MPRIKLLYEAFLMENGTDTPETDKHAAAKQYMHSISEQTGILLDKAAFYKERVSNAKSTYSRELYGKKLKKLISRIDSHIAFFNKIKELNDAEAEQLAKRNLEEVTE